MDIDALRNLGGTLHSPAQGVVGLSVGSNELYHFYSAKTADIDDIHNHRRSFTSTVLKGVLRNNVYTIVKNPKSPLCLMQGSCLQFCKATKNMCSADIIRLHRADVLLDHSFDTTKGSYYLDYNTFHNLELLTPIVITHIVWSQIQQAKPQFVRLGDDGAKCERIDVSEKRMWEIIESTL